jgi:hypothetical protein
MINGDAVREVQLREPSRFFAESLPSGRCSRFGRESATKAESLICGICGSLIFRLI